MSEATVFRFRQATFDFRDGLLPLKVDLVVDQNLKAQNTHFTLLMGANGTCKSRILSSCVNLLKDLYEQEHAQTSRKELVPFRSDELDHEMRCTSAVVSRDGITGSIGYEPLSDLSTGLPSRVLALANLVRDRFTFVDWEDNDDPFYLYLGVRQQSNMMTTGAMERIVCNATLTLLHDEDRYSSLSKWICRLFPDGELGITFTHFSRALFERFFHDPEEWTKGKQFAMRGGAYSKRILERVMPHIDEIRQLCELLDFYGQDMNGHGYPDKKRSRMITLRLNEMTPTTRADFGRLKHAISLAVSTRLLGHPALVLKSKRWLDFTQLSSGEQNLLATGARLIAFASPGSLVVIDEPEVSLNIAWQQRYIDLISEALAHANGSHVIIASHSPYLVSDLRTENSTVVVVERSTDGLKFRSHPGEFWGWGSEAVLYEVLGLPSASNYHFTQELAGVLKLITAHSTDAAGFTKFLHKCDKLDFGPEAEPLKVVIDEVRTYAGKLKG